MTLPFINVLAVVGALASPAAPHATPKVPFGVGEQFDYDVTFSHLRVGSGRMEIVGVEDVRGRPAYHIVFSVQGGIPFFRVNDKYESWIDTASLASMRYVQNISEGKYKRLTTYEIYPERAEYQEKGDSMRTSVSQPLDDGSFVYFIRTVPIKEGETLTFENYFKPDRNPVIIQAVRKERVAVPAGTFDALVIHPTIKAKGLFAEDGHAELWFSDDESRMMLQMKTKLSFGSLNLFLKSHRPATDRAAPAP